VECIGTEERRGSLTAVGAVSPPGGDLSEPVSQATMRIVKVFWALDSALAYKRHFPAINWLNSYSLYLDALKPWFDENLGASSWRTAAKRHGHFAGTRPASTRSSSWSARTPCPRRTS
jgi:V/A-type H+-transporting ATPase subunit A